MPYITAVATKVPPYKVSQQDAKSFVREIFSDNNLDLERLLPLFDHSGIETRFFSCPIDWFETEHSFAEKNEIHTESCTRLLLTSTEKVLEQSNSSPDDIDYIIYINTTGLATPSIDARLINLLRMRKDVRRTPIWGLGCAGGAAGLAHAYHYLLGHPEDKVLLVAAELCGLTFLPNDHSKSNLVATALFGEGAAAVLLTGDKIETKGIEILDTQSHFYPDSLDVMGWNIVSKGLQVVFAKRIPEIVQKNARSDLSDFLTRNNLTLDDIQQYIFHPGGMKVIEAYEKALNLYNGKLELCRDILRDFGNMSSVTILFVLERYLENFGNDHGGYGLMSALGPGFCSESLIVRL